MKNRIKIILTLFVVSTGLIACNSRIRDTDILTVTVAHETVASYTLTPTVAAISEINSKLTETAQPTEKPPTPFCVPPKESTDPLEFTSYSMLGNEILTALNNGVPAPKLEDTMINQGFASTKSSIHLEDLTGDTKHEIILSVIDPESQLINPGGTFMIFNCENDSYQPALQRLSGEDRAVLETRLIKDLNSDGTGEVIASSRACGAHTCFENYELLVWNGHTYENRLSGKTSDLPFPEIKITDNDGDGLFDIDITGTGIGSVGAGPQRSFTRRFAINFSTNRWEPIDEFFGQSNYRIHMLHDADANYREENYEDAFTLYTEVIQNDNLDDWMDPERERRLITGYAEYKIFTIWLINDEIPRAENFFEEMRSKYHQNTDSTYLGAMEMFYDAYQTSGLDAACNSARFYLEQNQAQLLSLLGSETFGYGNPEIGIDDLCP